MRGLMAVVATTLLAACAQSPESIAPAYVSDVPYQNYSCQQLGMEAVQVQQALSQASQTQSQARSNDIAGVILLGLPLASMSGQNVAPMVAQYRGQLDAIRRAAMLKGCRVTPVGTL
jgi:hypothetical protein